MFQVSCRFGMPSSRLYSAVRDPGHQASGSCEDMEAYISSFLQSSCNRICSRPQNEQGRKKGAKQACPRVQKCSSSSASEPVNLVEGTELQHSRCCTLPWTCTPCSTCQEMPPSRMSRQASADLRWSTTPTGLLDTKPTLSMQQSQHHNSLTHSCAEQAGGSDRTRKSECCCPLCTDKGGI